MYVGRMSGINIHQTYRPVVDWTFCPLTWGMATASSHTAPTYGDGQAEI